jgi:hypothetical protein
MINWRSRQKGKWRKLKKSRDRKETRTSCGILKQRGTYMTLKKKRREIRDTRLF